VALFSSWKQAYEWIAEREREREREREIWEVMFACVRVSGVKK